MSYSEDNTFEAILTRALENDLLVDMDKRPGSIIYDALAPVCLELAEAYVKMDILEEQGYLLTATGENLERRCYDFGVKRRLASQALAVGRFYKYKKDADGKIVKDDEGNPIKEDMEVPVGTRFIAANAEVRYEYMGISENFNILQCEEAGSKGNEHIGVILPLTPVAELVEARITSLFQPGEDTETDEELRERTLDFINTQAFGGNIPDYVNRVNAIQGVGQTMVFPAWNLNGSVLLSVVTGSFDPITEEFMANIQQQIDPVESTGEGVGIAPIGHYVTVSTPVKKLIDVLVVLDMESGSDKGSVEDKVIESIEKYFLEVRRTFRQDVNVLTIYRSRIIEHILNDVEEVVNVDTVLLRADAAQGWIDDDIRMTQEALLGKQYLPYIGETEIN